ncbi:unnamed protein product [Microthlaspi erraticum]|uniref:DUF1985 domain-containing protein n=1 Tax=Microthlaspi erraticum TaxID=1685480 RepID=A0A6D2JE34_9BRAS|nr:unnamed protein product [Microthlaspi erraticum]
MESSSHISEVQQGADQPGWDTKLPPRLFATGRYPKASLNVYSKLDHLTFIHHHLKDSPVMERIMNTCFGKLFHIPSPRCPTSGKLIHQLITRQLLTKQNHEMWMAFGGKPIRFGLPEFAAITGLPCGPFEDEYEENDTTSTPEGKVDSVWKEIVGDDPKTTIGDIADLFKEEKTLLSMSDDRKFKLVLILIVDGVLVATHQYPKPTPKYVSMLADIQKFLQYPWGRESFISTLTTLRPEAKGKKKNPDPVAKFRAQTRGGTMRLQGFPYALQLLALKNILILQNFLSSAAEDHTLFDIPGISIPTHAGLNCDEVLQGENHHDLVVHPFLTSTDPSVLAQYEWDDEVTDRRVMYLQKKIEDKYSFALTDWPHGDGSLDLIFPKPPKPKQVHYKQHIISRKKRKSSVLHPKEPKPKRKQGGTGPQASNGDVEDIQLLREEFIKLSDKVAGLQATIQRYELERRFFRTQRVRQQRRRFKAKSIAPSKMEGCTYSQHPDLRHDPSLSDTTELAGPSKVTRKYTPSPPINIFSRAIKLFNKWLTIQDEVEEQLPTKISISNPTTPNGEQDECLKDLHKSQDEQDDCLLPKDVLPNPAGILAYQGPPHHIPQNGTGDVQYTSTHKTQKNRK